jgi:O-antigen/teichoic acid export membrane protein
VNTLQRLLKNTIAMSATNALRLLVGLILTIYIARNLGPEFLGKYALLVTYINIFQILAEAGIPRLVTREVARSPQQSGRYFWNSLVVQLACSIVSSIAMVAVIELLGYPADTKAMLYVATGTLPAYAVLAAGAAILQAHERMEVSTLAEIISSVGQLVATILLLRAGYGAIGLAIIKVLGFALVACVNLLAVWRLRLVGRPQLDLRFGWSLLRHSSNILLMAIFGAVLLRLDVLIINQFWGEAATGIYNAAYQLVKGFVLLIWAYADAIYPLLSKLHRQPGGKMQLAVATSLQYGTVLLLPLAVGGTLLAAPIIRVIYRDPSFMAAVWPLRLLIWHLLPFFAHTILVRSLIASDRQDLASRIEGAVVLVAALFEVVLIYQFGMIGAALAVNLTFVTAVALSGRALVRIGGPLPIHWAQIRRAALAALGTGGVVWLLRNQPLWVSVSAGALSFAALALLLGAISSADRRTFLDMMRVSVVQPESGSDV